MMYHTQVMATFLDVIFIVSRYDTFARHEMLLNIVHMYAASDILIANTNPMQHVREHVISRQFVN